MFHETDPAAEGLGERAGFAPLDLGGVGKNGWALDNRPTLLVIAEAPTQDEIGAMAGGAGFRVTGAVSLAEMADRLALTVGVDALVIDLRGVGADDPRLLRTLTAVIGWPGWCDARPLLLVDLDALEAVMAFSQVRLDRLLCDPSLSDIGTALCFTAREERRATELQDIGRETDAARLEQLSAEVRRLAQTIDRLARDDHGDAPRSLRDRDQGYMPPPAQGSDDAGGASSEEVRTLLHARRLRERFLPGDLFADPAWDMMLDLLGARIDDKRVSVSSLCIASAVPPTTALRWIAQLTERGIFERRNDPDDARRVFISLSDEAADKLTGWFSAARRAGVRFSL